ncbi:MAG: helix-turn-helix domain-containing protein [Bacteroidota bacterium]
MNSRAPVLDFRLQRMEDIHAQAHGKADVPHRHDYYTVLLVVKATGHHRVDYQSYLFQAQEVHFVGPGQVHQVVLTGPPRGWVLTFSRDFLAKSNIPEQFITNINLFRPFGDSPPLALDTKTFDQLVRTLQEMEECLPLHLQYRQRALGALLQLFLIYANQAATFNPDQRDEEQAEVCILRDFKQLVNTNYTDWHKVSEYAQQMHITPKHLSQTVKDVTGKVAKDHIQDRLVLEAKRLLLHTDQSVKEVAYALGFNDPLHFSRFFKRQVGSSPTVYRTQ